MPALEMSAENKNNASWQSRKGMSVKNTCDAIRYASLLVIQIRSWTHEIWLQTWVVHWSKCFKWIWYDLIRPVQKGYQLAESSRNEVNLVQLQPQLLFPSEHWISESFICAVGSPCAHGSEHESCLSMRQSVENYWDHKACHKLP